MTPEQMQAIAKDAAERVHKNGGCVPQLAFAPILFALEDARPSLEPPASDVAGWRPIAEAVLDAASAYAVEQYGMGFLSHPADRERILSRIAAAPPHPASKEPE